MAQINKPTDHFRTKLYTGNATNDTAITFDESTNMKPDWLWIKNRSATQSHAVFDSTRGANLRLSTNGTGADSTEYTNLDSFDTNGFTVDNEAIVNGSGNNMLAWAWKANGGTTSSNTDGTITSTVQANTTAGFSIVSYTGNGTGGSTVGHGLGTTPNLIIIKNRTDSSSSAWSVFHHKAFVSASNPNILYLNSNVGEQDDTNVHHTTTTFNSTVFSLGTYNGSNGNGDSMIAYCFAEKRGFSKFGQYTGAGSGAYVYTGFKPAWVMWKSKGTEDWGVSDSKRDTFNVMNLKVRPNSNSIESSSNAHLDFLSNGFKFRSTSGEFNGSGTTYVYIAFAEQPLVGTNNIPCTAR